ncbi:hypothetical protein GmHk_01G001893 [Glycine max]|nr:hypothetical protein GmHk_01G001893 [Glycine max]
MLSISIITPLDNLLATWFTIGFHVSAFLGLAPIGIPSPPPFNFHFTPFLLHHILKTFFFHPTIKDPKQFESQLIVESLSKIKQRSNIFLLRIYWVQPNLISNHSKETKTLSVLLLANPFGLYHEKFLPTKEASTSSICSIKLLNSSLSLRHNIPSPTPSLSKGLLT